MVTPGAYAVPSVKNAAVGDSFQFERLGRFENFYYYIRQTFLVFRGPFLIYIPSASKHHILNSGSNCLFDLEFQAIL